MAGHAISISAIIRSHLREQSMLTRHRIEGQSNESKCCCVTTKCTVEAVARLVQTWVLCRLTIKGKWKVVIMAGLRPDKMMVSERVESSPPKCLRDLVFRGYATVCAGRSDGHGATEGHVWLFIMAGLRPDKMMVSERVESSPPRCFRDLVAGLRDVLRGTFGRTWGRRGPCLIVHGVRVESSPSRCFRDLVTGLRDCLRGSDTVMLKRLESSPPRNQPRGIFFGATRRCACVA
jgi:hypothetical protein